jgi:3-oxoacyl-[acyl-carrier-protein] synthase-1
VTLAVGHWGGAGEPPAPVVCATAAFNGVGLNPHQSWAFWRAQLSPFVESPFVCPNGERATMCLARTLPTKVVGSDRLLALARRALVQLEPALGRLPPGTRLGFGIGLSDRFSDGCGEVFRLQRQRLESGLTELVHARWPTAVVRMHPRGNAAFGFALLEAAAALNSRTLDAAVVGGVDSAYDGLAVERLLSQRRLFDTENVDSAIPGEGAAFVLLTRSDVARQAKLAAATLVEGAATDVEPSAGRPEVPNAAQGLASVMRTLTRSLKGRRQQLGWIIADVTNEDQRASEWMLALSRSLAPGGLDTAGKDFFQIAQDRIRADLLPECFGDLGACTMPTAVVLAAEAFVRGDPAPVRCLVAGASASAERSAVLLAPAPETQRQSPQLDPRR